MSCATRASWHHGNASREQVNRDSPLPCSNVPVRVREEWGDNQDTRDKTQRMLDHRASPPPRDLKLRTKTFSVRIVRLFSSLPRTEPSKTIGLQLLRSGTSVGAQYREAIRSRSSAEYVSKVRSLLQELEETRFWIELLIDVGLVKAKLLDPLLAEIDESAAVLSTAIKTANQSRSRKTFSN